MATVLFACWLVVLGGALSFANCFALFLLSFSNKCYGNKKKVQKKMEVKRPLSLSAFQYFNWHMYVCVRVYAVASCIAANCFTHHLSVAAPVKLRYSSPSVSPFTFCFRPLFCFT